MSWFTNVMLLAIAMKEPEPPPEPPPDPIIEMMRPKQKESSVGCGLLIALAIFVLWILGW